MYQTRNIIELLARTLLTYPPPAHHLLSLSHHDFNRHWLRSSASTYSPDGRIFQVEYASKAVENSGTAIGLKVKDGIVLAVEKLVHSKLLVPEANRRIQTIDRHIGLSVLLPLSVVPPQLTAQATAGLLADGRHLANRARDEASSYRESYNSPPPLKANRLGLYVQAYTLYSSVRPFGISSILGAVDKDGPSLYVIEPSGVHFGYNGAAVGKADNLRKQNWRNSSFQSDNTTSPTNIRIYLVHDDAKEKDFELELSWIGDETGGLHLPVPKDLFEEAQSKAKAALEDFE
ncbi:nucleophile aminohydrolase [Cyathus striatus]|nr:nucleophile aminohydrolase [Cyathus striatus]